MPKYFTLETVFKNDSLIKVIKLIEMCRHLNDDFKFWHHWA
jgi:hypothetical protein